jgi:N-acetylglucosaminyldiphosphoundecaprenol N-acetyl-beta-D-mannosaminyltransferase
MDDSVNAAEPVPHLSDRLKRIDLLGTPLAVTTYDELIGLCQALAQNPGTWAVDFSNTQIVTMRRHESAFRRMTSRVNFFIPDGMPLIWCLNRKGAGLHDRVYGPTFMRRCIAASPPPAAHYFLGGSDECLLRLQARLVEQTPYLRIVGAHNGYFLPDEEQSIVDEITRLSPDFIWVGLGTPKQQEWIDRSKPKINRGVLFAVGFAFDVNAGMKPDAPLWMQRLGLTWLFRIATEPRRLLTRYLRYNSLFLFYLAKDSLLGKSART